VNNEQTKQLCLDLLRADTEAVVISLLEKDGHWNNDAVWRDYGDYENNYNTIGNQQSSPDAALIEKIVNAIDARLMNECLVRGINPEGTAAPQTIRDAVARFFDEDVDSMRAGRIREWSKEKRTAISRGITVVATGVKGQEAGQPCFTIADCGEGQTPANMPNTLLSLTKSNKLRIPFVQGKFNMGSTGVLNFCGRHNLQLIITRRNPAILSNPLSDPSDMQWGFTIVRRENPEGGRRSSVYTYLAPIGSDVQPSKGGVLRFSADRLSIFPEGNTPYIRESEWGTVVKLYEYASTGFRTNMLMRDGLLARADILLPDVALPVRFHECRTYGGKPGSYETTLTGLGVRLGDDNDNLEFSSSSKLSVAGEEMSATIFALKKNKAETYRKNEGIIFTLNGQTHGHLTRDFFARKAVGLTYIADSVLVIVDCSNFSTRAREDLFKNSRDRLSHGELRVEIERALEVLLKGHDGLKALKEQRRREELATRLEDEKPLKETLESLLKRSPTLSALFLQGGRISVPFKSATATTTTETAFEGKQYPTFFRFRGKEYGSKLNRECAINMLSRIAFETDAAHVYPS